MLVRNESSQVFLNSKQSNSCRTDQLVRSCGPFTRARRTVTHVESEGCEERGGVRMGVFRITSIQEIPGQAWKCSIVDASMAS